MYVSNKSVCVWGGGKWVTGAKPGLGGEVVEGKKVAGMFVFGEGGGRAS